ncbi:MAG: hypothetical protein SOZ45_01410 [Ruminococcus sp.]|nr:hypothetical protein [Ruminococcus sp.]
MKINVIHDSGCEETEVTIKCAYVDDNLQKVINLLESENPFARPFLSLRFLLFPPRVFRSEFFAPSFSLRVFRSEFFAPSFSLRADSII